MSTPRTLRVLVALDPGDPRPDVMDVIAALWRDRPAELFGLFVEDINLHRLAELPFAREVSLSGASSLPLDLDRVERHFREQAQRSRREFERGVERLKMAGTFSISRGEVLSELERASEAADVLLLGLPGRRRRPQRIGLLPVHRLGTVPKRTVVVVQDNWGTGRSVLCVLHSASEVAPLLDAANQVARSGRLGLLAMLVGPVARRELLTAVRDWERENEASVRVFAHEGPDPIAVARRGSELATSEGARVVFLPSGRAEQDEPLITHLLERTDSSIVLLPGEPAADDVQNE